MKKKNPQTWQNGRPTQIVSIITLWLFSDEINEEKNTNLVKLCNIVILHTPSNL